MKKILSLTLVCVMLLGCVFALASCKKTLNGTYEGGVVTYTFKSNGEVTAKGGLTGAEFNGKYEITTQTDDDGNKETVIIFSEFSGIGGAAYNGTFSFGEGKDSDKGAYVKINGVSYYKK